MAFKVGSHWWMFLLRGLVAIVFGIMALFWHAITLEILVIILGIFLLLEGVIATGCAIGIKNYGFWWICLLEGIFSFIAGIMIIAYPGISLLVLFYIFAVWILVTSVIKIFSGVAMPAGSTTKWMYITFGLITLIFSLIMFFYPNKVLSAIVIILGFFALVAGLGMVGFSMLLKQEK